MAKNIALFSDGTGNSSAKAQKTNVWRLFEALDQTGAHQIAKYDDGVGTSSNKYLAILGGAFGWGLKRNVIDLYKFVCRNYCDGDRIYGFGFSRGAFTIRVVVGFIAREGLVTFRTEEELAHHAAAAYRSYRYKAFPSKSPIVSLARRARDGALALISLVTGRSGYDKIAAATRAAGRDRIPIRFLGLWDSVEAYTLPIVELKRAINWALWPMLFGDMRLATCVQRAVHALSLDDERTTFHPLLWDEEWEQKLVAGGAAAPGRITQVWFAGVHSNVGGGYPEDQLALVSLAWIMREAAHNGLGVDPAQIKKTTGAMSPFARLYDSRAGLAAYYRYAPRQTPRFAFNGSRILSIVNWSVLLRMVSGSDLYAPVSLPHQFKVMMPSGALEEISVLLQSARQGSSASGVAPLDLALLKSLEPPDTEENSLVWDTIFWRRCLYILTVALTVAAVAFPWFTNLLPGRLAVAETAARGPVSSLVSALSALVPSYATRWKEALTTYPLEFGTLLVGIALTLAGSRTLETRIHDRARLVWHSQGSHRLSAYRAWRAERRQGFGRTIMLWSLVLAGFGAAAYFHYGVNGPRMALGFICGAILLAVAYGVSLLGHREPARAHNLRVRSTLALKIGRLLRENRILCWAYARLNDLVIPTCFVTVIIVGGVALANRVSFDILSSAGLWCRDSRDIRPPEGTEQLQSSGLVFHTHDICWASGLALQKGRHYTITITMDTEPSTGRWFDRDRPADVMGFPARGLVYTIATPLKRSWGANWFQPIARIGRFGNDEYVLQPASYIAVTDAAHRPACLTQLQLPRGTPITGTVDSDLARRINECSPVPPDRRKLTAEIEARGDGELFIYVNDAVLGVPGVKDFFLRNNSGTATVTVVPNPGTSE